MRNLAMTVAMMMAALPVQAADLWCMPDRLCRGEVCKPTQDEETSVRLEGYGTAAPTLRVAAEDVPMQPVQDGALQGWQGRDGAGAVLDLVWRPADAAFTYRRQLDGRDWTAHGRCEVQ